MKIVVDKMPENGIQCCFGETNQRPDKVSCTFTLLKGVYSRCSLDCDKECKYLVDSETLEKEKKIRELNAELDALRELIEDNCISGHGMERITEIVMMLSELEDEKNAT